MSRVRTDARPTYRMSALDRTKAAWRQKVAGSVSSLYLSCAEQSKEGWVLRLPSVAPVLGRPSLGPLCPLEDCWLDLRGPLRGLPIGRQALVQKPLAVDRLLLGCLGYKPQGGWVGFFVRQTSGVFFGLQR